ncbi:unnamed protein product [Lactuca saligna]|uniref:Uncharacterized protein n=1 Tax=Lactuca saligna TaxID=75948 RepID=A0AA35YZF9_LACSI|nr:unnamed protein product [Lactuca saligna]
MPPAGDHRLLHSRKPGFKEVNEEEKRQMVGNVFTKVMFVILIQICWMLVKKNEPNKEIRYSRKEGDSFVLNSALLKLQSSCNFIPVLGELVAKDRDSYQYLVESVRRFPPKKLYVIESG